MPHMKLLMLSALTCFYMLLADGSSYSSATPRPNTVLDTTDLFKRRWTQR